MKNDGSILVTRGGLAGTVETLTAAVRELAARIDHLSIARRTNQPGSLVD